jgi:hypothetical protein
LVLKNTKSATIVQAFNQSLSVLWPENIIYNRVLVLVTDGAPNMKCAAKTLCETYDKLTHIICISHGLHNVCELIIKKFPKVNRFLSCGKKIFKKSPYRIGKYQELYPDLPLPPEPVITRWGSWLEAIEYYALHFKKFVNIVKTFNSEDSIFIDEIQHLIEDKSLLTDITIIYSNFNYLPIAINKLLSSNLSIHETIEVINSIETQLMSSTNPLIKEILIKFKSVFDNNKGFQRMKNIAKVLNGEMGANLDIDLSPFEISLYKYCCLTNADIERSFSIYRNILSDRRLSFDDKNLSKYFVIQYNSRE